jgi:hypothetical protein
MGKVTLNAILLFVLTLLVVASTIIFVITLMTLSPLLGKSVELIILLFLIVLCTMSSLVGLIVFLILTKKIKV